MRSQSPESLLYPSDEECMLVCLATGDKTVVGQTIQSAYHTWQALKPLQKFDADVYIKHTLEKCQMKLYESLIQSFEVWDQTQMNSGAPGWCIKNSSIVAVVKHIGEDLFKLLREMKIVWKTHPTDTQRSLNKDVFERFLQSPFRNLNPFETEEEPEVAIANEGNFKEDGGIKYISETKGGMVRKSKYDLERKGHQDIGSNCLLKDRIDDEDTESKPPEICYESLDDGRICQLLNSVLDNSSEDISLEKVGQMRNLRIDDCQEDPDFDKQISPLLSDEDTCRKENL